MSSLFIRKRGNNYNVIVEFINDEGKKKQKSVARFENEEDAHIRKKELLQDAVFRKRYSLKGLNFKYKAPIEHEGFFVYRFLSFEGLVLYVGSTININKRMKEHNHLPKRCYENTYKVQYIEVNTHLDMLMLEIYYINKYNAKYNKIDKYEGGTFLKIQAPEWKNFDMNEFTPLHNY